MKRSRGSVFVGWDVVIWIMPFGIKNGLKCRFRLGELKKVVVKRKILLCCNLLFYNRIIIFFRMSSKKVLKKVGKIFGGMEKLVYFCIRKSEMRRTNKERVHWKTYHNRQSSKRVISWRYRSCEILLQKRKFHGVPSNRKKKKENKFRVQSLILAQDER